LSGSHWSVLSESAGLLLRAPLSAMNSSSCMLGEENAQQGNPKELVERDYLVQR